MSEDPLGTAVSASLSKLVERSREIGEILTSALQALEGLEERRSDDVGGPTFVETAESLDSTSTPIARDESTMVRAFRQRLEGVHGVGKVTYVGTGPNDFRFLVELTASS